MEATEDASQLIRARLAELAGEERRLYRALSHLEVDSRQMKPKPTRRRGRRSRGRKPSKPGQRRKQLLAAVKAKPGHSSRRPS